MHLLAGRSLASAQRAWPRGSAAGRNLAATGDQFASSSPTRLQAGAPWRGYKRLNSLPPRRLVDSRITLTSYNTYVVNQNLLITSLKLEVSRRRSAVCPYACIYSPRFQILEIEIHVPPYPSGSGN